MQIGPLNLLGKIMALLFKKPCSEFLSNFVIILSKAPKNWINKLLISL